MTLSVTHSFLSTVPDGPDQTLVKPSDWNHAHTLTAAASTLLGNPTGATGAVAEIALGTGLSFAGNTLNSSGGVTSVSNADGTLNISPTTGAVVASIATNGVAYANLATAAQGLNFSRLAKTANYTVANGDKGKLIALGGNALFTLTLNAASGYDSNFSIIVLNEDTGRAKKIAANGLTTFFLWPGQSIIIYNDNNSWAIQGRARYAKSGHTLYVSNSGSSSNDGIDPSGPLDTVTNAINLGLQNLDALGSIIAIQLADGTYTENVLFFGGMDGSFLWGLGGAVGHGASVVWQGSLSVKDFAAVTLSEITITTIGVSTNQNGTIDIAATVTFGACAGAHITASVGGTVNLTSSYSITGAAAFHWFAATGGRINVVSGISPSISAGFSFTSFALLQTTGLIIVGSSVSFSGAGASSCTGLRFNNQGGYLSTGGTNPNSFLPGNADGQYSQPNFDGLITGDSGLNLQLIGYVKGVNFNSANTDNAIELNLPSNGATVTQVQVHIYGASGTLTTATFGLFTSTGGGGTAIIAAGTAITVSTASDATANNGQIANNAATNQTTFIVTPGLTKWYFRVGTAEGSAATGNVALYARCLP